MQVHVPVLLGKGDGAKLHQDFQRACRSAPSWTALMMPRYRWKSVISAPRLSGKSSGSHVILRSSDSSRSRVMPASLAALSSKVVQDQCGGVPSMHMTGGIHTQMKVEATSWPELAK